MTESFRAARDQTMIRRANELSVLAVLRDGNLRTMRDIADATGLSWRTTNVVAEALETQGWLAGIDADPDDRRLGRPARRYRFRAEAGYVVGIDIGAHAIAAFVADLAGTIVGSHRLKAGAHDGAADRLAATETAIRGALADAGIEAGDVWAAAVGSTGVIGPDGTVTVSAVLPDWTGLNPAAELAETLPCPITVANDCNLAALAERWRGHSAHDMIYLLTGVRLGAGLVIGGQLHRGSGGAAGEVGEIRELGWNDTAERLAATAHDETADRGHAAKQVFQAARDGDAAAIAAVDRFAADVARGLTAMVVTIDPELVVMGGDFTHAADLLLPRLATKLTETCLHKPRLEVSELGDDSVVLGAVWLALDTISQRIATLDSATPLAPAAVRGL